MNWSVYNDALVRRGEVLLDFSILDGWDREVKLMNAGRISGSGLHNLG